MTQADDQRSMRERMLADEALPADTPHPAQPLAERPGVKTILPAPFDWIDIPGKGYSIAKYPITNAQFARFIEAGGYKKRRWWTGAGWEAKAKGWAWNSSKSEWEETGKAWAQPRYWTDSQWNGAAQPVVGVSWYEAVAFCLWLSDVVGENIMLPTEDQWQYAAQGDDGRVYPWGKNWDSSRCNHQFNKKGVGKTTPVTRYEGRGDSPFGVVDMAGNVWEWCLTDCNNGTNYINSTSTARALRGGSWDSFMKINLHCDCRNGKNPSYGFCDYGFRVSRS